MEWRRKGRQESACCNEIIRAIRKLVELNGKDSSELMLDSHVRASFSAICVVMIVTDDGKGGFVESHPEPKWVELISLGHVQWWEADVVYARFSEWKFRIVYFYAWTSDKLVLGFSTKYCLATCAWCSAESYSPITKICLFQTVCLFTSESTAASMQNIPHASAIDFFGLPHRWRTRKKFSLHSPRFVSHISFFGRCQWSLSLVGGSAVACPSNCCHSHSNTWPHTILSNTHRVFKQPIAHFHSFSLSWAVVLSFCDHFPFLLWMLRHP